MSRAGVRAMPVHRAFGPILSPVSKHCHQRRWVPRPSERGATRWRRPALARLAARRDGPGRARRRSPGSARAGRGDGDPHRGVAVRPAGVDRPHRRRRRSATPARRSTSPRASAASPACSRATARTTRRTCRSRCAASAPARPSASAACASTSTASRRRCPTARARSPTSTSARPTASRSCAGRSRRSTATPRAASSRCSPKRAAARRPSAPASAGGSYGALRFGLKASGGVGGFGYVVSGSTFRIDGYREHSAAERNIGNAKLTWRDDANRVTLVVNSVALPKAQDPLGLTRAQFDADPRGVDPAAIAFDTRKTRRPDAARPRLRAPDRRRPLAARARLQRPPQHRAVPGDPGRRRRRARSTPAA